MEDLRLPHAGKIYPPGVWKETPWTGIWPFVRCAELRIAAQHNGPVGDVFTYGFSTMAENLMPGGQAYRDYDPIELTVDLVPDVPVGPLGPFGPHFDIPTPDVEVSQTLPLPAGNLSNFDDRWGWIENDMLPRYQELLQDPHATRAIVSSDVAERAADQRKLPDLYYPGG